MRVLKRGATRTRRTRSGTGLAVSSRARNYLALFVLAADWPRTHDVGRVTAHVQTRRRSVPGWLWVLLP